MGQVCFKPKKNLPPPITQSEVENNSNTFKSIFKLSLANMSNDTSIYHNNTHVIEVVDFMKKIINEIDEIVPEFKTKEWRFILVASAYMHDICHPAGQDRAYIEDVAKYVTGKLPDFRANLEHLHSEIGIAMIKRTKSFSRHMTDENIITELIKATELKTYTIEYPKTTIEIAKLMMRCSDLCHFTFELPLHLNRVTALNKEMGLDFCVQDNAGFINEFVIPQFELLVKVCGTPRTKEWLHNVMFKYKYWSENFKPDAKDAV